MLSHIQRGRWAGAAIMALLAVSGAARAAASVITQPDWAVRPNAEDLEKAYPTAAATLGLEGRATIGCEVGVSGRLVECKLLSETPPGLGFGAAAMRLASVFRMRPMTRDGQPSGGGRIRIPLEFRMAEDEATAPGEPPTPEAVAAARKLVVAERLNARLDQQLADDAENLVRDDGETPAATRSAAAQAWRAAAAAHRAELEAAIAVALAREVRERMLLAYLDVARRAPPERREAHFMIGQSSPDYEAVMRRIRADARAVFCREHACGPVPPAN